MQFKKRINRLLGFLFWSFVAFFVIAGCWKPTWESRSEVVEMVATFFVQRTLSIPDWFCFLMAWYVILIVLAISVLKANNNELKPKKGG